MDKRNTPPLVGGSSLLVIFAVLCLTTFALLGLSGIQASGRLADTSAQAVENYYAADCHAEEIFARLRQGELPEGVAAEGGLYTYRCPISETQELQVELAKGDGGWTVLRWEAASVTDWQSDTLLDLWDGDPIADLGQ